MADYVPRKGELIALTFDLQSGHEQRGRRPALVVSNDLFNGSLIDPGCMHLLSKRPLHLMENAGHAPFWDDAASFNQRLGTFAETL